MHFLELHYFLANDTIEIKEVMPPNSGVEAAPMFLKRMRIPRVSIKMPHFFFCFRGIHPKRKNFH